MSNRNSKNLKFKVLTSSSLVLQTKQILPAAAILRPLVISPTISQKTSCRHFEIWNTEEKDTKKELIFQSIIHCFEFLIGCVLIYFCWLSGNQKVISEVVCLLPFQSSYSDIVLCILTNDLDAGGWCLRNNTKIAEIVVVEGGKKFPNIDQKHFWRSPYFYLFSREYLPYTYTWLIKCTNK